MRSQYGSVKLKLPPRLTKNCGIQIAKKGFGELIRTVLDALQSLSRRCIIVNRERTWLILPVTIAYVIGRSIDLSWNLPHVTSSMRPLRICNSIFPTSTPAADFEPMANSRADPLRLFSREYPQFTN